MAPQLDYFMAREREAQIAAQAERVRHICDGWPFEPARPRRRLFARLIGALRPRT